MDAFAAQSANAAGCAEAVPMQFQHKNANFSAEHPPEPKTAKKTVAAKRQSGYEVVFTSIYHTNPPAAKR